MQRQDGDDARGIVAPDHGIAAKPVVEVQVSCTLATDPNDPPVVADGAINVRIDHDRVDKGLAQFPRLATVLSMR